MVGAITPFNAPANLLVQKIGPALATGNAVVVKPHPTGIETALLIAELCKKAGLPDGLYNVIPGDRAAALALAAHPQVSVVTLTGGVAAAEALARAAGAKKFCAELGSSAANIVLADANLEDAAQKIARAGFEASGQQCISAQRVIVEKAVFDRFLALFVAAAKSLKVGLPDEEGVDVGPMVNVAAAERVMAMVADTVAKGAKVALEPVRKGAVVSPGILVGAARSSRLLCEEVFGPVVVVQPAENLDDALAQANDSQFGLQGACFHGEPGCGDESGRAVRFRLGVDQRGQPVSPGHVPLRRREAVGLRARRHPLCNGGVFAMEIRRPEVFGVTASV